MPDYITVKMEGLDELSKALKKLADGLPPEQVEPILKQGAKTITDSMKQKAPKGPTGNLKKAIKVKKLKNNNYAQPAVYIAAVDRKKAPHAHLVEFGHGGPHPAPPYPFFRPAVDENENKVYKDVEDGIKKLVERAIK